MGLRPTDVEANSAQISSIPSDKKYLIFVGLDELIVEWAKLMLAVAGLPMAAKSMFHTLGVGPAMSILGGVATLALPVPFLFMRYGLKLRKMSKFAPVVEE